MTVAPEAAGSQAEAEAALAGAISADGGAPGPGFPGQGAEPGAPPANQPQAEATPQVDPGTPEAPAPDSGVRSADIDLSHLPPDARAFVEAREKEMQGDYTRKTQELAEQQKLLEGLDPTAAREALDFYQGIRQDPNYAAEVYDFLTAQLMAAGYSPAQAAAAAQLQGGQPQEAPAPEPTPSYEDDPDAALQAKIADLDRRQSEIDGWFQTRQQQEMEANLANEILRQDNAIQQANPHYTDSDMEYLYKLAESTQGNLFQAQSAMEQQREQWLSSYIERKQQQPDPGPASTAPAETPLHFDDVESAHRAALEKLRQDMSQ